MSKHELVREVRSLSLYKIQEFRRFLDKFWAKTMLLATTRGTFTMDNILLVSNILYMLSHE